MKKKVSLKLIGFILAVVSLFVVIAGFYRLGDGLHVKLFGTDGRFTDDSYVRFPFGLFVIYLGLILELIGSALWAIGYKMDPPSGTKTAPSVLALRAFSFIPIISGLFVFLGSRLSNVANEELVLLGIEVTTYLMFLGLAIMVVFGLIWWFFGLAKSEEKTCILLLGNTRSAKFLRDYRSELKKIAWPSRQSTVKQTGVVLASIVAVALVIGLLDYGLIKLVDLLSWLATKI